LLGQRGCAGEKCANRADSGGRAGAVGCEGDVSGSVDAEHGISLRYPRNYAMEEGEPEEAISGVKSPEGLEEAQPGARLLATIVIPEDGYPNTTFVEGSLQLAVNPALMQESCNELSMNRDSGTSRRAGTLTIQGVLFHWGEETTVDVGTGTEAVERDYAGYSNGACYEFFIHVTVGETANSDGLEKQADAKKIVRHLERIASSLQTTGKAAAADGRKIPSD